MVVRAQNIKKEFLRKGRGTNIFTAVAETDFALEAGELTVIRGRSGSGKSTFLNMLSGILEPTAGTVHYDKDNLYAMPDAARSRFRNQHIGFIPQGQSAIASLSVRENIMLPVSLYGAADKAAEERADALMDELAITPLAEAMPTELSGGELRRMAIARALLRRPGVLFADEPTGDLDDENTKVVFHMLRQAAKDGTAVLMVTHEGEAQQYADRLYRMTLGVLEADAGS